MKNENLSYQNRSTTLATKIGLLASVVLLLCTISLAVAFCIVQSKLQTNIDFLNSQISQEISKQSIFVQHKIDRKAAYEKQIEKMNEIIENQKSSDEDVLIASKKKAELKEKFNSQIACEASILKFGYKNCIVDVFNNVVRVVVLADDLNEDQKFEISNLVCEKLKTKKESVFVSANVFNDFDFDAESPSNSTLDKFREDKQKTRQQEILYYDAIIQSDKSSSDAKSAAENAKQSLVLNMEKELAMETQIKASGIEDCVVLMTSQKVTIYFASAQTSGNETSTILSVVSSFGINLSKIITISVE